MAAPLPRVVAAIALAMMLSVLRAHEERERPHLRLDAPGGWRASSSGRSLAGKIGQRSELSISCIPPEVSATAVQEGISNGRYMHKFSVVWTNSLKFSDLLSF
jgi:hypothetical protein